MTNYKLAKANLPRDEGDYSFGVFINTIKNVVSVGLSDYTASLNNRLGADNHSIGYYSNGQIDFGSKLVSIPVPSYSENDIITVRSVFSLKNVLFYKNEELVYRVSDVDLGFLYPTVCLTSNGDSLTGNFGQDDLFLPPGSRSWDRRQIISTETDQGIGKGIIVFGQSSALASPKAIRRSLVSSLQSNATLSVRATKRLAVRSSIQPQSSVVSNAPSVKKQASVQQVFVISGITALGSKTIFVGQTYQGSVSAQVLSGAISRAKFTTKTTAPTTPSSSINAVQKAIRRSPTSLSASSGLSVTATFIPGDTASVFQAGAATQSQSLLTLDASKTQRKVSLFSSFPSLSSSNVTAKKFATTSVGVPSLSSVLNSPKARQKAIVTVSVSSNVSASASVSTVTGFNQFSVDGDLLFIDNDPIGIS